MSYSSQIKFELSTMFNRALHCNIAELSAVICFSGTVSLKNGKYSVKIQTENLDLAQKYFNLMKYTFNIHCEVMLRKHRCFKKNNSYFIISSDSIATKKLLMACGLLKDDSGVFSFVPRIYPIVVGSMCCKRAYIRGAFLSSGFISDPKKSYHLEFSTANSFLANQLRELINSFNMDSKIIKRKNSYVVYLKEGGQIVDILNIINAHGALLEFENLRILKDVRNNINRAVNCETANISKTISASVSQLDDINLIDSILGLKFLPKHLRDVVTIRQSYPEASLKEIGEMLYPKIGKSGVNHRLRKISNIADSLRNRNV